MRFLFRPLWQLDTKEMAQVPLVKAQATQVYAGLEPWLVKALTRLAEGKLLDDGTYPTAGAVDGGWGKIERFSAERFSSQATEFASRQRRKAASAS